MKNTFQDLMRAATRLTREGHLGDATRAIQRALSGAGPAAHDAPAQADGASSDDAQNATQNPTTRTTTRTSPSTTPHDPSMVLDGCVFEVAEPAPRSVSPEAARSEVAQAMMGEPAVISPADPSPARPHPVHQAPDSPTPIGEGDFRSGTHTHATLTRSYKLYVPPGAAGRALPLVVMLHGCTQDPDDFAAGTAMNERAREQGFFVLYPAQSQSANAQRCWNWFKHNHQQRGSGEPALIADMTRTLLEKHGIDPRRVYVAGLSAGGAMAAIMAAAYPDIFAAVGVHSGLPGGSATNVAEALGVMKSGTAGSGLGGRPGKATAAALQSSTVPTIVFHGDNDQTVHPRNGEQVIASALAGAAAARSAAGDASPGARVEQGAVDQGRRYTRSTHVGDDGKPVAEHWLVHGAGHAWSGGHASGSYTDAKGPDATREMLRFFFEHPLDVRH